MKTNYISDLFFSKQWYLLMTAIVVLFCIAFFFDPLFYIAVIVAISAILFTLTDLILLFVIKGSVTAERKMAPRFSLGDENTIDITIQNKYPFQVNLLLIDELPFQFQDRTFSLRLTIPYAGKEHSTYTLRPVSRGIYEFGNAICYVKSPFRLLQRRFIAAKSEEVKVYPSYLQLKRYQLQAFSDSAANGIKKIRRVGHSLEFEKIKEYVQGDDIRTINWKATARTGNLMVNTYTDARQQQVFCMIDKGRAMKMPFDDMTLLDHSINAALVLLNVVLVKHDKAGLITFSNDAVDMIPAERRSNQLPIILETLYKQQTEFKESNYESLSVAIRRRINQRSLLLLFTNFETYSSLERQLPYLMQLASRHLLCVVFFQNTLLKQIYESEPDSTEGIYIKTIAEQFDFEKKQIVKKLRMHGILSILTTPENLTVDVINKYLELKARQMV